ncbi:NAD(P)-binding protein [Trematosphaeria pertusa]|uniref:NAD(P)-binding protein n=1 Tax=Trematosphaeria pertusa TaxID=390896 RepID=A0A6A6IHS2_9PLEO|nr:NAD(P)-binding protein [Trematosphaeria pertusa]KAF2250114.1 NAD(P)-binding protein [Trematosphaeria pertusa]
MSVFRAGARALITGGASGIGLAVAELCLGRGMRVAVVDFNEQTLDLAKKNLSAKGEVQCVKADILSTNLYGVLHGLNTYIPSFQSRAPSAPPAAIVITGSKQGITNPPGNPAYNASKAAVKTLAEHLSWDLREKENVGVHLLVPGWTFTGLSGNTPGSSASKPAGAWTPAQVTAYMQQKMEAGKFYIICPDNDVSAQTDKKRMLWSVGDIVKERPPLTRWREEYKREAEEWMAGVEDVEKVL